MTVWKKIDDRQYAVAIYNYAAAGGSQLELDVGDLIQLEGETEEWYWGRKVRGDERGAFPKTYVILRECHIDSCDGAVVASAGGAVFVHDIAVTLREWLHHWKDLYTESKDDRFKFIEVSMRALLKLRAEAASGALPQDQLRKVARTALFTIDKGNRALGMELAVRNSQGHLVNPLEMSTYKLNTLHEETNLRVDKNMETTPAQASSAPLSVRTYTVLVRVHNVVCRAGGPLELGLALYSSSGARITEHAALRWTRGVHTPAALLVFTDLSSEIKKEKVFLVCHVVRVGAMEPPNNENRRSSVGGVCEAPPPGGGVRRAAGVACGDVTRHLASGAIDTHIQLPYYPCEKEYMDALLKKLIANREPKDTKHSQGLWVSLQLVEGDLKQISEEAPHLVVGSTAVALKMGLPEVVLPGDARNDLYVNVCAASLARATGKAAERNVELVARCVDKHGQTLRGVISVGAGAPLTDEFVSVVYYHDNSPRWQETFKVCLNIEEFKEAHLVFLCRHRSSNEAKDRNEKPFALSYLRLMQREGTTIPDGQHDLCVYKLDTKRGSWADTEREACAACAALPSTRGALPAGAERGLTRGPLSLAHKDHITVDTKLCSTKLTQREEILGVLKWSTHHSEGSLRNALSRLLHVPSEELVKFLQDILDALFNILTQVEEDDEDYQDDSYAVLVLECLLRVVSLVADHKYLHFQPVLRVYIDESFCDALAYERLLSVMVWTVRRAEAGEGALKRLLQCMKCLEWLVRLVARSRQLRAALGDTPHAYSRFNMLFERFLESLVWLMRRGDSALTCQGSALKYLPHAAPHALSVYPAPALCEYIVRALETLPLARLGKQRMLAALEFVRGPLAADAAARRSLLPHLATTICALLKDKAELDREAAHKCRSVDKAARLLGADSSRLQDHTHYQQIVELCVETLGEMLTLLARDDVGPVETDREDAIVRLLPTVLRVAASMLRERDTMIVDDSLLRKTVCLLLDMVRQITDVQYTTIVRALEAETLAGVGGTLVNDALSLLHAMLRRPVFKAHWADMLHLQHYIMLHGLRLLSTTLRERLSSTDAGDLDAETAVYTSWREWFSVITALATSAPLQLEALTAARKQRVVALYGDVRRSAAELVKDMWFGLGTHKRAFIPHLVGPMLELAFLRDEEVRSTIIPLFYDMMKTEYGANCPSGEGGGGHLKHLESEMIDKLDVLVERGCGDVSWRARFVTLCGSLCRDSPPGLQEAAAALVAAAARQLDTLLEYRAAAVKASTAHRMHLTMRVLLFYEQIERPHMYIRYVHKLCEMHRAAGQWAEAGLALRLHAALLAWSATSLPPRLLLPARTGTAAATQRELKESLYLQVAELLNRGRQWELAVEVVKELVSVYEEEALGYGPLAELHTQLAELYSAMLRTPRSHPGYFRVVYHGTGFPEYLRVPQGFVYRGNEYEQLQDFKERLLDEWPEAEVLPKLDPPGEDITQSDGQYLQINAVDPVLGDKLKRLSGRPVSEPILQYYMHNNVDTFTFSRPFHRHEEPTEGSVEDVSPQNEFATRWLERTEMQISDKLPGILRWFPIIKQRTYWVSPVEAAVEALRETNRALKALILEAKAADAPLQPLTMRLSGILDPAVQGGIVNYEKAFLTPSYESKHPEHASLLEQLKDLIADQIPLLKYGLEVHEARMPQALEGLHSHMQTCFKRIQHHVHQRYGRKVCEWECEGEVQLRAGGREGAAHRVSDASAGTDSTSKSKFFSFNSAMNPLTRTSGGGVVSYFGTLQNSPKRRDKRRARKSEVGTQASGSQWYTSHNGYSSPSNSGSNNNNGNNNNSFNNSTNNSVCNNNNSTSGNAVEANATPLRELRQELVTERPLRDRRASNRASVVSSSAPHSNRDSMGTTDSNQDEEEPPPLPQKSHRSFEVESENIIEPRYNYDVVWTPRGSFLYNSMVQKKTVERPPTPPPKKKHMT